TSAASGVWRTSLDLPLQTALEAEIRHTVNSLSDRGVREAALVVLDNRTGELLAWVGSPDFWADSAGQVDMVVSPRQPGSALKPFLYGLAFERGYTPASVLPDVARAYATSTGPYQPRNYDRRFHGPVRVREALASSYSVPAVGLADRLGAASRLRVLHGAGFGQPMRSVSGITGAGPLLHRAMLVTARRFVPGELRSPRAAGATRVRVCALSGLRAIGGCPDLAEWFLPGTAPAKDCDWHQGGAIVW